MHPHYARAKPGHAITVSAMTIVSYCSQTQALWA